MPPRPSVKAILICDQVIHEFGTNKKSLIGIFEQVHVPKLPVHYPRIAVYVNLTDARGRYHLELRLLSTVDGSELGRGRTPEVEITDPLRTCEFALQINNLLFKNPGKYEFQVLANDELLATKSFTVKTLERGQRPPVPPPWQAPGGDPSLGG